MAIFFFVLSWDSENYYTVGKLYAWELFPLKSLAKIKGWCLEINPALVNSQLNAWNLFGKLVADKQMHIKRIPIIYNG